MYQSRSGGARQMLGASLAVGAIQVGIAAALLTTFAGGEIRAVFHRELEAHQWTYVPPPAPRPTSASHASAPNHDAITAPKSAIDGLSQPSELILGPLVPLPPMGNNLVGTLSDIPEAKVKPALPPVAAHPLGDPGAWISPDDYPLRALHEGWSGVTRLHLVIGGDGRVSACTVIASSGHDALDAVACEKVTQRARFSPARDGAGLSREGAYDKSIHWQIQEE